MAIPVTCPCGRKLRVPDARAGKKVKCPQCSGILTVPASSDGMDLLSAEPAADRCPRCGTPMPPGTVDCAVCWAQGTVPNAPVARRRTNRPQGIPRAFIIFVSVVVCLILGSAGVVAWVFLRGDEPPVAEAASSEPETQASQPEPPKPSPVAGIWHGQQDFGLGETEGWLTLTQTDEGFTGSFRLRDTPEIPLQDLTIDGSKVTFRLVVPLRNRTVSSLTECEIEGDRLTGTTTVEIDGQTQTIDVSATRVDPSDVPDDHPAGADGQNGA